MEPGHSKLQKQRAQQTIKRMVTCLLGPWGVLRCQALETPHHISFSMMAKAQHDEVTFQSHHGQAEAAVGFGQHRHPGTLSVRDGPFR